MWIQAKIFQRKDPELKLQKPHVGPAGFQQRWDLAAPPELGAYGSALRGWKHPAGTWCVLYDTWQSSVPLEDLDLGCNSIWSR